MFIVSIAGTAFFSIIIFSLALGLPVQGYYMKPASSAKIQTPQNLIDGGTVKPVSGLPIRLKIPKIRVDAAIESVGLTPEGAVGIPKGPTTVAWFNLGPRPGDNGSAIISGHYGPWRGGIPTVFNNLYKLRPGDKIYIKDSLGVTTAYVVRELRAFGQNDDVPIVFGSSDGQAHLNLVTCQGIWNKAKKSYSERLIVFTDKE